MSDVILGPDQPRSNLAPENIPRDLIAGLVVFLVALPLCLGIALASGEGVPLMAGLIAGIVGGLIVAPLSGSHTSVSGPAAGLTAIVAAQLAILGSFDAFLLAVVFAGVLQIGLGVMKAGALSAFFPSSVIKGLLAAIGVILILKQFPHLLGHDADPDGEMSFVQPDHENTFTELLKLFQGEYHYGAILIGVICLALLVIWPRIEVLKKSIVPSQLVVVIVGVALGYLTRMMGGDFAVTGTHLVDLPVAENAEELLSFLQFPDWSAWTNPALYMAAVTIALVASLESLLNLEAVDNLDPRSRKSPPSRELIAQGCGNMVAGLIGGLPVTAVIVRGSVNVNAGSRTKMSAIFHGILLVLAVAILPQAMNKIPLASLAAILIYTGFKLASPQLFRQMWNEGKYQFIPFIVTLVAIVFTDLLIGILIGLGVALFFILRSSTRRPIRRMLETNVGGDLTSIELSRQVSFLNRAALDRTLSELPRGSQVVIDASDTDYIDPDILSLIRDFESRKGPARGVKVSLTGFQKQYSLKNQIRHTDFASADMQRDLSPEAVLKLLKEGNRRFRAGTRLPRDFRRQIKATRERQTPLAVVLGCIDSRVPTEVVFDLGIGDIFSVRVAGNVLGDKTLGSIEYGVGVAGVKLVVVLGHTRCGAVSAAVDMFCGDKDVRQETGCDHLHTIVDDIKVGIERNECSVMKGDDEAAKSDFVDEVVRRNVRNSVRSIVEQSRVIREGVESDRVMVVGAVYNVSDGEIEFLDAELV